MEGWKGKWSPESCPSSDADGAKSSMSEFHSTPTIIVHGGEWPGFEGEKGVVIKGFAQGPVNICSQSCQTNWFWLEGKPLNSKYMEWLYLKHEGIAQFLKFFLRKNSYLFIHVYPLLLVCS